MSNSNRGDSTLEGWFDNHCHLGGNAEEVIGRARDASVLGMITVGTDLEESRAAVATANAYPDVWATAGVHPHEARRGIGGIAELLKEERVVAVGEAGLDYYYDYSPRGVQADVFAAQIELANRNGLPLVIHSRDAWEETFEILDAEGTPVRTVFHCFTGGPSEAEGCLGRGALLSFSGILTFQNAENIRLAASCCPLDRVLVETDSPYLTPEPYRGRTNEPANLVFVGEALALAMGRSGVEVANATTLNAREFYALPSYPNLV